MFDHLPGDALETGEDEQELPEPPARVVLAVVDVVLEVHLHLVTHRADLLQVTDATGVCKNDSERLVGLERSTKFIVMIPCVCVLMVQRFLLVNSSCGHQMAGWKFDRTFAS